MSVVPTKLGADRQRVVILGALVVLLVVVYLWNRNPDAPAAAPAPVSPVVQRPAPAPSASMMPVRATTRREEHRIEEFRPSLKLKEGTDLSRIDPTLRGDLLAKLKSDAMEGGVRSIFDFGAPPPPPVAPIKPGALLSAANLKPGSGSKDPAKASGAPAGPPPPPPIPLKFFGYANSARGGAKRAFFLDGDDIQVAGENDTIRNRYKIIRIGVNSVVVEDMQSKHEQTLPLVEEMPG